MYSTLSIYLYTERNPKVDLYFLTAFLHPLSIKFTLPYLTHLKPNTVILLIHKYFLTLKSIQFSKIIFNLNIDNIISIYSQYPTLFSIAEKSLSTEYLNMVTH